MIVALALCLAPVVIDGDTLRCAQGAHIRLWGVDTPEIGEPGHDEATRALRRILPRVLSCDPKGRSYNRIVAQCFTLDGEDIGKAQLRSGYAVEVCRFSHGYYGGCRR